MKYEELRESMRMQAYLGWIIYLMQPTAKRGSSKITLEKWLKNFGLLDNKRDKKTTQENIEDIEKMKIKSLDVANKIIAMDKKR